MNESKTAEILSILSGAFPNQTLTEEMAEVWTNALAVTEFTIAERAAREWVQTERWWPTVAQFNGVITRLRGDDRTRGVEPRPQSRLHCDGSGWIDRGEGPFPCPACNPWQHELHEQGDLFRRHPRPPAGYYMPPPCSPRYTVDDQPVTDRKLAVNLMTAGYREAKREQGMTDEQIDQRLRERYRSLLAWIAAIPQPLPENTEGFDGEVVRVQ